MSLSGLHKFKLFASHLRLETSASAGNPSMSPSKSPVLHLRRRRTLRMFFEKSTDGRRRNLRQILEESQESDGNSGNNKKGNHPTSTRRKLKELLVTSPSPPFTSREEIDESVEERRQISPVKVGSLADNGDRRELIAQRFGTSGSIQSFRFRILRKHWRPVLVSIPEQ